MIKAQTNNNQYSHNKKHNKELYSTKKVTSKLFEIILDEAIKRGDLQNAEN